MDRSYKLVLSNGREIDNLRMNGNNFISDSVITADMFEGGLSPVMVYTDDIVEAHNNMDLVQITRVGSEYWFVLREIPQKELDDIRVRADVDFIAMISDVEL